MSKPGSKRTSCTRLIAGAMSGTSADGVDVAIVDISGHGPDMKAVLRHYHAHAYPAALRKAIFHLRGQQRSSLDSLARLGQDISLAYATAINDALTNAALRAADLWAIAAHGQTLFHRPPLTLQWLDPALLAARVGCRVISDFRRADCAAGGQGAPLVPFADRILFGHRSKSRVLLNLGGIANITWLPKRADPVGQPIAFDTGPANCLSDCLMRRSLGGAGYDAGGALAKKGHPIRPLAEAFLRDQYFIAVPPKSTDIPSMIAIYQRARQRLFTAGRQAVLGDELATACQVAAASIVDALGRFLPGLPDQVIASGGGTANHTLMGMLRRSLRRLARTAGHPIEFLTSDDLGIPSSAKEAIAFALLGAATLDGLPANVPSATGAERTVVLGSITPGPRTDGGQELVPKAK